MDIGTCLGPCTGTCTRSDYYAQVTALRRFLAGKEAGPLPLLEQQMKEAAAAQQYEVAAALRDRWRPMQWLANALARLRLAQQEMSFVYPIAGADGSAWWYLIHGARVVTAVRAPADRASKTAAAKALRQVYRGGETEVLLEPYEHADGMMVVLGWFRKYPQERQRVLSPAQALAKCR
jgi:excinuclease ABC subunit C